MTGLDIEAIRARGMVALSIRKPKAGDPVPPAAVLAALFESVEAVPLLLAEVERLTVEARNAEFEVVELRGVLAADRRRHEAELREAGAELRDAQAALADALQVIADLRGGTS